MTETTMTMPLGNSVAHMPKRDLTNPSTLEADLVKLMESTKRYFQIKESVNGDHLLSTAGKEKQIAPHTDILWRNVLRLVSQLDNARNNLEDRETAFYAVEVISTPYEIARDRERRDWFRALPGEKINAFIEALQAGEEHAAMVAALMRSPVPLDLDWAATIISEIHNETRRRALPDVWQSMLAESKMLEWVRLGVSHVIGASMALTGKSRGEVLKFALDENFRQAAVIIEGDYAVELEEVRRGALTIEEAQKQAAGVA